MLYFSTLLQRLLTHFLNMYQMKIKLLFKTIILIFLFFSISEKGYSQMLSGGDQHSAVLCSSGIVKTSGYSGNGNLGNNSYATSTTPVQVNGLTGIIAVSCGSNHTIALRNDGTVWAWGYNGYGNLGDSTYNTRAVPVQVRALSGIVAISACNVTSYAVKSDGTLWAWGQNNYGQLGDGTTTGRNYPVQVIGLTGVTSVAAGYDHALALKSNGTVFSWGENGNGQLGNGGYTNSSTAGQINSLTGITAIAANYFSSMALKSNGTAWTWGYNGYGQLGDGTYTSQPTPVQVITLTGITAIAMGNYHTIAIKNNGTAWTWGYNGYGQLGDGTTNGRNFPAQVSALTAVANIGAGSDHSLFQKSDGSIWGCGYNDYGQLGDGTVVNRYIPVKMHDCCTNLPAIGLAVNCITNDTTVQSASSSKPLKIYNTACGTLVVSSFTSTNAAFSVNPTSVTINAFDSATVNVVFLPTVLGNNTGTLTIHNNNHDTTICLSGYCQAVPAISVSPTFYNVSVPCGDTLLSTLHIINTGSGNLNYHISDFTRINIALVAAEANSFYITDVKNKLLATGKFNIVDIYNGYSMTPTLAQLEQYQAVLVWSNNSFTDAVTLGNNLADYVDAGGGVVTAFWVSQTTSITGRFNSSNYWCIDQGLSYTSGQASLGTVYNSSSPIMAGVTSFNGGTASYRPYYHTIDPLATRVADWSDGAPLIVARTIGGTNRVDLGFWPVSNDVYSGNWLPSTNGALIMANSLIYSANRSSWLHFAPASGTATAGNTSNVTLKFDSRGMVAGIYHDTIHITSNDPNTPLVNVPVTMDIVGTAHIHISLFNTPTNCLNLDSIMAFTTIRDSMAIANTGCDTLRINSTTISPAIYSVVSCPTVIPPGITKHIIIQFAPVATGTFTGSLTLHTSIVDTAICLTGKGYPPPIISTTPPSFNINLGCSDSLTTTLAIHNTGGAALTYSMQNSNLPIAASCTPTNTSWCCAMGIYNVTFGSINNTSLDGSAGGYQNFTATNSALLIPNHSYSISVQTGATYPENVKVWIDYNNDGIFQAGELVYSNLNVLPNTLHTGNITIPITAVRNQALRMRVVSDYSGSALPQPCTNVQYGQFEDYTVKIGSLVSLSSYSGTVPVSSTSTINVTFNSNNLTVGTYTGNILINTNDPLHNPYAVPYSVHVGGAGTISLRRNCLYLDSIMQYTTHTDSLYVKNIGCDTLKVTNITHLLSIFTPNQTVFNVLPGDSVKLKCTFAPTSVGSFTDTLTILNNNVTKKVCLTGKCFGKPNFSSTPTSFNITLACCDSVTDPLTIHNTGGGSPLTYQIMNSQNFTEGFETGLSRWVTGGTTGNNWTVVADPHTGTYSLKESPTGFYSNNDNQYIELAQPLTITNAAASVLTFWSKSSMECCCDAYRVEISVNGGAYSILNSLNCSQPAWGVHSFSLTPYVVNGDNIKLRFLFTSDYSVVSSGVNIDDITITGTQGFPDWLSITPLSGVVTPGSASTVNLKFKSCGKPVGTYTTNLRINSNDPLHPIDTVPLTLHVVGAGHIVLTKTCLNLDSIMQYTTHADSLYIKNTGCDTLKVTNITNLLSIFTVNQTVFNILPGDSAKVIATFAPVAVGTFTDTLTILNNNITKKVCLTGKGFQRPIISVNPDSILVTLTCADSVQTSFTINNSGGSILNWTAYGGGGSGSSPSGYCIPVMYPSNSYYYINSVTTSGGNVNITAPVDAGFTSTSGPGVSYFSSVMVSQVPGGSFTLTVQAVGSSAYFSVWVDWNRNGVFDASERMENNINTGTVITNFTINVPLTASTGFTRMRIIDWTNGSAPAPCGGLSGWYGEAEDYLVRVGSPGLTLAPNSGNVNPSGSQSVQLDFNSTGLNPGVYNYPIVINSNDPLNPTINAYAFMTVVGSGHITLSRNCLNLDSIMQYTTHTDSLYIRNTGCDTLKVTNITNQLSIFSVNQTVFNILPGDSAKLKVTFAPVAIGSFTDTLTILNNDITKKVCLSGKGFARPIISTNPNSLTASLSCCDSSIVQLHILNTGGSNLNYHITGRGFGIVGDTSILVIQETTEWGVDMQSFLLTNFGRHSTKISSSQIAATNFNLYDIIIVCGDENYTYYNNVSFNKPKFEAFANAGGIVQYQLGNSAGSAVSIIDNVNVPYGNSEQYNTVLLPNHSIVSGLPTALQGNNANTGYFANLPLTAQIITETQNSHVPTTVEYTYGNGLVIATSMEWGNNYISGYNSGPMLTNACAYSISKIGILPTWLTLQPATGSTVPSDSSTVNVKFKSCGLLPGTYNTNIIVHSNDPLSLFDSIHCTMQVTGTGIITLNKNCINFDSTMIYTTRVDSSLFIRNTGCDTLLVSNITHLTSLFTVSPTAFIVLPGDSARVTVSFSPLTVGTFNDSLTILNNDTTKKVCLSGNGFPKPVQCHSPSALNVHFTICQDSIAKQINVCNTNGGSNLNWNLTSNLFSFVSQSGTIAAGGNTTVNTMFYKAGLGFGVNNYSIYLNSNDPLNAADTIAVTITVDSIPPTPPTSANVSVCFGNAVPHFTATGNSGDTIKWYNASSVLQHIGATYNTGLTAVGVYTFYVTATDSVNGCQSRADTVLLHINSAPTQPTATDASACFGTSIPSLTSTGTIQLWYTNPGLTNHVFTGNAYNTGLTAAGTYTFYVSDSTVGCPKSPADMVTLTIHALPSKPIATDVSSCFGTATPSLSAAGTGSDTIKWYSSSMAFIQNGNPLVTGLTSPGTYNYYVTQTDSLLGCISPRDTATLSIHFTPQPTANNQTSCFGGSSTLTAIGVNLKWYNSAMTLMFSGNPYNTGLTAVGVDTFYVTQTLNGCESTAKMVILNINPIPSTPIAPNAQTCFGQATPLLTATGTNVQWYSNPALTTLVHSGSPYNTGLTAVGNYTFYVTQSALGCASHPDTVHLNIGTIPVRPITSDVNACFGFSVSDFVAATTGSDTVRWYSNPGLTNLVYTGNPFATGQTAIGTYTYYVNQTDTSSGCHSFSDTVTLFINSTPVQPTANDVNACFGQAIPPMTSTGTIIQWYNNASLTNLVHTGATYNTGITAIGSYTFYIKDSTAGCASSTADTATLNIYPIPTTPATSGNASICIGQSNPTFTATGTNVNWYSNAGLTTLVHTGSTFTPTQTTAGTYTFYVTQTANGCSSLASIVVFTIYYTPPVSVSNISIPFGSATPDLIAVGSNINWYNTAMVNVSTNDTFATGQTAIGAYTYYVTQTLNGCASTPDTVTLTIHPLAPVSASQTICFGNTVPDLTASGTNIKWYSNASLTTLVHTGNTYPTGQTAVGVYTYFVTQTVNSIPSPATIVSLTINAIPTAPVSTNQTACVGGTIPNLTSSGTNVQWYDSTFVVHTGTPFATGHTTVGIYNYTVTQTVNGCESPHTSVSLTINALPSIPVASDTSSCFGSATPDLTAAGTNIHWFNTLGTQVGTGSSYSTGLTAADVYNFFVTQTNSSTGCQSLSDTVTLTINFTAPPTNSNVSVCSGLTVPPLTATGTNIQWFNSTMTQVATGSSYSTGQTAVGVYTYFVTQTNTITGCQSIPDSVVLTINAVPLAPVASDANACFGQSIPSLTATGTGIQWYTTSMTLVSSGNSYNTEQTAVGTYTYYVTQNAGGCEGPADTVTLTIHPIPASPTTSGNTSVCFGQTNPTLTATGTTINWYSDSTLVTLVHSGSTFTPTQTAPGVYTYYVTQTVNGCNSPASIVVFTIYFTPPVSVSDISISFGTPTPDLIAAGTNITWYDTAMVTVSTNDTFATGQTAIGVYTFYVSQTMNGCQSTLDTVVLTIYPSNPPALNQSACFGTTIPDLSATGTNIQWYNDSLLTTLVYAGNPFSTLQTAVGVYTYYVTQTINGIESPSTTVTLTINAIPSAPVSANHNACFGGTIPNLTATGTAIQWYDTTTVVFNGNPYATGQTASGVYSYSVTQTVNGCESPHTTVTLTINALPVIPIASDTAICFGTPTPDLTSTGVNIQWYDTSGTVVGTGSPFATGITAGAVHTFYVTQTNTLTGCESHADTVNLTIHFTPPPIAPDVFVCALYSIPDLTSTGTAIQWYDSSMTFVHSGTTFNTGQTAIGTHVYFVTQTDSVTGCTSTPDSVILSINTAPAAPVVTDATACFGQSITPLTAVGTNLQWYGDTTLTTVLFAGNPYNTGQTAVGTYTYYVTQTTFGCEGPADSVTLTIYPTPVMPTTSGSASICFGQTNPAFTATGTNLSWYSDSTLTTLVGSGGTFTPSQTTAGVYTYYITQSANGCSSPYATVVFTIYLTPPVSVANASSVFGSPTPDLIAVGSNITWYDTAMVSVSTNDTFATGQTAVGAYTYYVSQTLNSCESTLDTVVLTIYPVAPTAPNQTVCYGNTVPDLTATGLNVQWFSDSLLTVPVYSGSPYATGDTVVGTYTYYLNQTENNITSAPTTVTLTINAIPSLPIASSQSVCAGGTIPDLTTSGTNITWYDTAMVTVSTNDTFATGQTAPGVYTYTVTQTVNGCESPADTATLTIYAIPLAPTTSANTAICFGTSNPAFNATGTNVQWYSDSLLTTLVFTGSPYTPLQTTPGTYTYYVTDSMNGCTSPVSTVALNINFTPPVSANDTMVAYSLPTPDLIATGTNITWYDTAMFIVSTNDTFATGQTAVGVYTYYVTQNMNGCESTPDTVVLTIYPGAPIVASQVVCAGTSVPDLTAVGLNIEWYNNAQLDSLVYSGSPFATGQTSPGTYVYYATQTVNGIQSPLAPDTLTINSVPDAPLASNQAVCFGGTIPDLITAGTNIHWYDTAMVTVSTLDTFATGQTSPGIYIYTVTETVNGCESAPDTASLTIHALPATPVATDASACFGSPVPDLTSTGNNIMWYDTASALVGTGSPFATGMTASGVYAYHVIDMDTVTGCSSIADTATLTISVQPNNPPVVADVISCTSIATPDLIATSGNIIHWYSNAALTNLVNVGNTFATGQTAAGTYTYYVTDSLPGCIASPVDTATLTINTQPTTPPAVADVVVCSGGAIPDLMATTGTIVNWYSDGLLTNLVNTGFNFPTGQTTAGVYTYYVNDNIAGCPAGMTDTVSLTINQTPAMPSVDDTAICFRTALAILIFHGQNVQWYNTSITLVHSGDVFNTAHVVPGIYPYYVTQTDTVNGCVSPVDSVNMIINSLPGMPITSDVAVCASAGIPNLTAIGNNVQWYDTANVLLFSGASFATGQTVPGTYPYYVVQNDTVTGCGSNLDTATLVILPVPSVPVANNITVCTGTTIPDLSSTGTNVTWYSNATLTTIVNTGNTYTTGQTAAATYTYYVTDSVNGCTSTAADSVSLTINQSPPQPTAHDTTICIGGSPVLFSTGNNPHWYSDVTLINLIGTGNNFNTGATNVGTTTYYVTDNNALCPNSSPDTAHLTINPAPLITANTYSTSVLFGGSVTLTAYNAVSYSWAPPTGLNTITGATVIASSTITTTYTVTGTNAQGCSSDTIIHVYVTHTGIDEASIPLEDIIIYPNPAIDEFTIEFSTTENTSIDIYLFNKLGQTVRTVNEEKNNSGLKKHKYTFDTSTLDAGVYSIEIATEQGSVSRRLVLIK